MRLNSPELSSPWSQCFGCPWSPWPGKWNEWPSRGWKSAGTIGIGGMTSDWWALSFVKENLQTCARIATLWRSGPLPEREPPLYCRSTSGRDGPSGWRAGTCSYLWQPPSFSSESQVCESSPPSPLPQVLDYLSADKTRMNGGYKIMEWLKGETHYRLKRGLLKM